jgi:hypothetical protein
MRSQTIDGQLLKVQLACEILNTMTDEGCQRPGKLATILTVWYADPITDSLWRTIP